MSSSPLSATLFNEYFIPIAQGCAPFMLWGLCERHWPTYFAYTPTYHKVRNVALPIFFLVDAYRYFSHTAAASRSFTRPVTAGLALISCFTENIFFLPGACLIAIAEVTHIFLCWDLGLTPSNLAPRPHMRPLMLATAILIFNLQAGLWIREMHHLAWLALGTLTYRMTHLDQSPVADRKISWCLGLANLYLTYRQRTAHTCVTLSRIVATVVGCHYLLGLPAKS